MYFDPSPKEKIEDFYNYENELKAVKEAIERQEKIIIIKGVRRIGKTSLMKVISNELREMKIPYFYIDAREVQNREELKRTFLDAACTVLKEIVPSEKFLGYIKSISIGLPIVKMNLAMAKVREREAFGMLDEELGKKNKKAVIFIDEVQRMKRFGGDAFLAYLYDNIKNLLFVMGGSEVGILEEFAGASSEAPLYGRAKEVIELRRLAEEKTKEFLRAGFEQAGKKIDEEEMEEISARFDGIIGWLSLYGHYRKRYGKEKAIFLVEEDAEKIVGSELENFLKNKEEARKRYLLILFSLIEKRSWSEIKMFLELRLKERISDSRLYAYIQNLLKYGFIEEKERYYFLADPLLEHVVPKFLRKK